MRGGEGIWTVCTYRLGNENTLGSIVQSVKIWVEKLAWSTFKCTVVPAAQVIV